MLLWVFWGMEHHSKRSLLDYSGHHTEYFYSAFFDNITYTSPKVPTLYTVMSSGPDAVNPLVYGEYTHPFVLEKNQIIEIVVNNLGKQPLLMAQDSSLMCVP